MAAAARPSVFTVALLRLPPLDEANCAMVDWRPTTISHIPWKLAAADGDWHPSGGDRQEARQNERLPSPLPACEKSSPTPWSTPTAAFVVVSAGANSTAIMFSYLPSPMLLFCCLHLLFTLYIIFYFLFLCIFSCLENRNRLLDAIFSWR
jgi:hypothetical protein